MDAIQRDIKKCVTCKDFFQCFNASNDMIGKDNAKITNQEVQDAMQIPACEGYK